MKLNKDKFGDITKQVKNATIDLEEVQTRLVKEPHNQLLQTEERTY